MAQEIFDKVEEIRNSIAKTAVESKEALEAFRIQFLGSKNEIKALFGEMRNIPNEQKKKFGQLVNEVKMAAESRFKTLQEELAGTKEAVEKPDLSAPGSPIELGSRHPIAITQNQIVDIFSKIGFTIAENREIEDEWHNFTALNTPDDHPARDMTDTYYLAHDVERLLRSQTSTVQVHVMENEKPPIRIISPGRVYRNETISARAHCQFHQVEGLYIDKDVSFADLKQTLLYFAKEMFGPDTEIRLRPSYFPFTEPSAEVDVTCFICQTKGCNVCKYTGWVEILGCGMVDPNVLKNCNIDPEVYTGFAFGMGVERQAMLKYRINDIRLFFENDIRFLKQFTSAF